MTSPRAAVIGAAGIDTNVYLPPGGIAWDVESNFTTNLDVVGQAGAYSARGLAALGWAVTLVGAVGDDPAGTWVRRAVAALGIDAVWLHDPVRTHRSVNLVAEDGGRKNFYDGGGAARVEVDLAAVAAVFDGVRLAHFHLEDWCRRLLPVARDAGATISCDLQDLKDPDDAYRRDFVASADVLFFSGVDVADPAGVAQRLLAAGPAEVVVAGLGADGALVASRSGTVVAPAVASDLPVVDTNGAGDALAAGFLWAWVQCGWAPEAALAAGQTAARWACAQDAAGVVPITEPELRAALGR